MIKDDILKLITRYDLKIIQLYAGLYIFGLVVYFFNIHYLPPVYSLTIFVYLSVGLASVVSYLFTCLEFLQGCHEEREVSNLKYLSSALFKLLIVWAWFGCVLGLTLLGVSYGS